MSDLGAIEGRVHHEVLSTMVWRGRPPGPEEIARALDTSAEVVRAALGRLHDGHGLVLHPDSSEVWVAHPFSASPTSVWVDAGERGWWAPCLWCATGISALAAPTATIHTRYAGEQEEVQISIRDHVLTSEPLLVHFSIPPRDAWRNVIHWCSTVLPFRDSTQVARWCERHGLARGAEVPLDRVIALGRAWYGRHLDETWRKWTTREAQDIFDRVGLTGDFWRLPVSDAPF
jgi:hypothetical protein